MKKSTQDEEMKPVPLARHVPLTADDLGKICDLMQERASIKNALLLIDTDYKNKEKFSLSMDDYRGGYSGMNKNTWATLTLSREMVIHHFKDRLTHVEIAITTYGVAL